MQILPANPDTWQLTRALIAQGELVAFPTDTVYGVACDPYNVDAIMKLYAAKGRAREKAIPLLLSGIERINSVASSTPACAERLGSAFWPGALTLVVPRKETLPQELGGGDTIAVRVPGHAELLGFIESCGGALATTSANISGMPDAVTAQQAAKYLGESVQLVVDGGRSPGGVPSTVVDCTKIPPVILRRGAISEEAIWRALQKER